MSSSSSTISASTTSSSDDASESPAGASANPSPEALLGAWTGSAAFVYCRDLTGHFCAANEAFARKFGRPADQLAGKPVPGLTNATFEGAVTLVNVWASWCVPCHDEVPFLEQLSKDTRIQLVGINYKDAPDNARRFLNRYGNPFVAAGRDDTGRASIDWGVYGVPETFLVGRDSRIAYKLVGPITEDNLETALKPAIEKALAQ